MTNRAGQTISAPEFLHTRVLTSQSGEPTDLGTFLCSLFPSLECHTLPIPSINPSIIKNIVEQQNKLKPTFNKAVDELIQQILQQVTPKKATDGVSDVDGPALSALICGYVDAINTPGAIPNLEHGWQAVIKWKLKEMSDKLVEDYRTEMEECLERKLPTEERNLMILHEETLSRLRQSLQQEIHQVKPFSSTSGDSDPILEQAISRTNERGTIIGGVLFQFTTHNYSRSKQQCEEVLMEIVKRNGIHKKCQEAIMNSQPLDITAEIQEIDEQYHRRAIGPAASEVLEKGHRELNVLGDLLKKIPGPPGEMEVTGRGPDRVKLSWQPPEKNPEAVENYVVWRQEEGKQWERVREIQNTKTLIVGLKSNTHYQFQVTATNSLTKSIATTQSSFTQQSKAFVGATGGVVGAVFSPVLVWALFSDSEQCEQAGIAKSAVQSLASIPVGLICAPVAAPVAAVWYATKGIKEQCFSGDLSQECD